MRSAAREVPGRAVVTASWSGTVAFALTAGVASLVPGADVVALAVAVTLFLAGFVIFWAALVRAARRSRFEDIGVTALFLLDGAPGPVRGLLLGAVAAEVAVAIVTAAVRPNTSLAFGILVPVYGLALSGLWGAHHGTFEPRRGRP